MQFASKIAETESWKFSANSGDFKELCRWSCATRDHELGGMANRLSALGVVEPPVVCDCQKRGGAAENASFEPVSLKEMERKHVFETLKYKS